ncbi:MAG: hypothetical protein KatS3mg103_0882 [Phycisphaerales bacterium]|nr:MAG: hypothetical protein KatS3mg103_0882 [Phycisphaerales bacterium]
MTSSGANAPLAQTNAYLRPIGSVQRSGINYTVQGWMD